MSTEIVKRVIGDKILIQQDRAETQTSSGLYIPTSAATPPPMGTVLAAGPESTFKRGERVAFGLGTGHPMHIGGQDVLLLTEADIICELGPSEA